MKQRSFLKKPLKSLTRLSPSPESRRGSLRLDMNENPSGLPDAFVRSVLSKCDPDFLATYPEVAPLQRKLAQSLSLDEKNLCLANGSDAAIKYLFDAFIEKGDRVLLTDPTFAMYPIYCQMFDAEVVTVNYRSDLSFPLADFKRSLKNDIKMAVIINPNNPTGSVLERKALLEILEEAAVKNILMVVDEAYFHFYPETVIQEIKKYRNLIVLRTFSKLCAIAALRLGFAAASPDLIQGMEKVKPTFAVNGLSILFGEELLGRPAILKGLIQQFEEGKEYLIEQLRQTKIAYVPGQANFVLIDCGARVSEIKRKLAAQKILVHGVFSQSFLKKYLRVTVGNSQQMEIFWKVFISLWKGGSNESV